MPLPPLPDDAREASAPTIDLDALEPPRPRSRLPWLLCGLLAAAFAALLATTLDERARTRRDLGASRDEAAALRTESLRSVAKVAAADRAREEANARALAAEQKLVARSTENDDQQKLITALRAQLGARDGDVSQDQNRISVSLVDEILFKSGDAHLSPRGEKVLARVGAVLKGLTDKQILIGGHTDDKPIHTADFPSNWELSTARAVTVVRYLIDSAGVDPGKLTAAGYSQFHPRSRDRARNRRIEILLTPAVEVKKGK